MAAEIIADRILNLNNEDDLEEALAQQAAIQETFQKTTHSLTAFNDFSAVRYNELAKKIEGHTKHIKEMKTDLDCVFKKIRAIKAKLAAQYPEEFAMAKEKYPDPPEEDE